MKPIFPNCPFSEVAMEANDTLTTTVLDNQDKVYLLILYIT